MDDAKQYRVELKLDSSRADAVSVMRALDKRGYSTEMVCTLDPNVWCYIPKGPDHTPDRPLDKTTIEEIERISYVKNIVEEDLSDILVRAQRALASIRYHGVRCGQDSLRLSLPEFTDAVMKTLLTVLEDTYEDGFFEGGKLEDMA